ncbi:hypothetical protein [Pseudomonas luteola]|uniref:hypothetical protein n=1 Tax=Pseudomonas TaxID=286 RepID=UPI00389118D7
MDLSATDFHDATLVGICLDWEARTCRIDFAGAPSHLEPFSLTLSGVTELVVPTTQPWGPSCSVLAAKELAGGGVAIEMQSGDTITVVAPNNSYMGSPNKR